MQNFLQLNHNRVKPKGKTDGLTDRCNTILWRVIKKTFTMNLHLKYYSSIADNSQGIAGFKFLKETRQSMFVKHVPPLWAYFIEATK